MTTVGDPQALPCPSCGEEMDLTDVEIDGCLKQGFEDECVHCGSKYGVDAVDYAATIWASARVAAETAPALSPGDIADSTTKDLRDEMPPSESPAGSLPGNQVSRGGE